MNIGAAIFGVFCLFIVVGGITYVAVVKNQQAPITDTYGNTYSNVTNTSGNLTTTMTQTPGLTAVILIAVIVIIIMVLFGFYIYSKMFMTWYVGLQSIPNPL